MLTILIIVLAFLTGAAVRPALPLPRSKWKVRSRFMNAHYLSNQKTFKGVQLYAQKGFRRMAVHPELNSVCLDPNDPDYIDDMIEYREKARQMASALNVDQKMLRS